MNGHNNPEQKRVRDITPPKQLVKSQDISHQLDQIEARVMPCLLTCEVRRLTLILKDIKIDKLKTLKNTYELTVQIRRSYPERDEEMARNMRDIEQKTLSGVAELMTIEEELARGCTTCRDRQ